MTKFLKLVSDDLMRRFPDGMQHVTAIFPNKRARLFLNEYILQSAGRPVWAPTTRTMQELFISLSDYRLADPVEAICILYKVYDRHLHGDIESLDKFYGWGQVLISDFDDIDKHMVDAHALFTNIKDLEDLSSDDFLTDEQEQTLRRFFEPFSKESNTEMRQRFRRMWGAMADIYDDFHAELRDGGCLTEGALYRDVAERIQRGEVELPADTTYAFIGLNALCDVEKRLMHSIGQERALFYWDYDKTFLADGHEAGIFMADNLKEFPGALPSTLFDNIGKGDKKFTYVATAGSNVQARYIPMWLREHSDALPPSAFDGDLSLFNYQLLTLPNTAIVLCDEALLEPVLHSIPDAEHGGPSSANITMGFPMTSTPVYSLLRALMTLHTDGYDQHTGRLRTYERRIVESHPLISQDVKDKVISIDVHQDGAEWLVKYMRDMLEFVAGRQNEALAANHPETREERHLTADEALASESVFRAYTVLQHIEEMVDCGLLQVSTHCLSSVIDQALTATSIPFHGEPVEGLQVMGVLETRCLDFDNVLMLSVGEGKLPRVSRTPSFIPYSLRRPFRLTTIEQRVGIEAYHFYRLLERARNVTFVYDTANAEGVKNEMSRFLRQLLVEMRPGQVFPDKAITIKPDVNLPYTTVLQAQKTPKAIDKLSNLRKFSPTALEEYVQCPLKYYLHYVGGVDEFQETDDEMDAATFGNIFHASAEDIYREFIGRPITRDDLERYTRDGRQAWRELQTIVDGNFDKYYFEERHIQRECMDGALAIRRDVITRYLLNLLRHDLATLEHEQREVIGCELPTRMRITLEGGRTVTVGGIIDRLDKVTGSDGITRLQIVDYKTMSRRTQNATPKADLDLIFTQKETYLAHIFQTFVYSLTLLDGEIAPADSPRADKDAAALTPYSIYREGMAIQPAVFYTQDSSADNYSTLITFNEQTLTDFRPLADDFRDRLKALLESIFAGDTFTQTTDNKRCTYCPFKDICRI